MKHSLQGSQFTPDREVLYRMVRTIIVVKRGLSLESPCWAMSTKGDIFMKRGARWLSGRVSDSGARGREFETYRRHVVSLSKTLYSPKVLVIPRKRWLRPDMTEKLLTGTLSLNTNKQIFMKLLQFKLFIK